MFNVKIRDHIMIAHSLPDIFFGKAQQMHGATYIVDVTFYAKELNQHNVVIDIGQANTILHKVLDLFRYQNLDSIPEFKNILTTTEFLARYIHSKIKEEVSAIFTGKISVTLGESHVAWASYED